MIAKVVSFVIALAAAAAAAAVVVVSAAFAVYAFLRIYLGPAGAAGCVTLVAAVVLGIIALVLFSKSKGGAKKPKTKGEEALADRLTSLFGDRPIVAAGAAVAAGLLAWRNPTLVNTLLRVMEPRANARRS